MTGCKKDDSTPPTITLEGSSSMTISLQGTYTEPGFTAEDDRDGDLTASVTSDESSTNPNKNLAGTYTIHYEVTDAAGNTGTEERVVQVVNDAAAAYAGTYQGNETDINGPYTYVQKNVITASTTVNNRISMTRLGDFANNTVYMDIVGTSITLPSQTVTNVGTGSNSCDVHDRKSDGTGSKTGTGFTLTYNDQKLAPCTGSRNGVQATFVKQ